LSSASTASSDTDHRIGFGRLAAFSLTGLPLGALAATLGVYLPRYFVGNIGLSLGEVGIAFTAVRLFDMLLDPAIGILMDRTRTRLGRYRVWLLAGIPLLGVPVYMLYLAPKGVPLVYLIGWLVVYYAAASVLALSQASWASVIASKYHERSRVFGALQITATVAATLVLFVPTIVGLAGPLLVGHKIPLNDVQSMGWFVLIMIPLGMLVAGVCTPERIVAEHSVEKVSLKDYAEMAWSPEMRRIVAAAFCLTLGPGWMSAMYLFYFHDSRGFSGDVSRYLLALYIGAGVLGAWGLSWLATRLGKHYTLMIAATLYSVGLMILNFLPKGDLIPAAAIMFSLGFLAAGFVLLGRAMCADAGDAIRLAKGKHRQSVLYAMMTMVEKVAGALAIGLTFTILGAVGYQAKDGAHNTPGAIHNLELVYLIGPITFVMLGGFCYIGYKLDHKRHAEIRGALAIRDALSNESPIIESLGGAQGLATAPAE
jgi:glycoside/pentoside/hexuronide:cation symporter, GPH family